MDDILLTILLLEKASLWHEVSLMGLAKGKFPLRTGRDGRSTMAASAGGIRGVQSNK